jgi:hypothetical protein
LLSITLVTQALRSIVAVENDSNLHVIHHFGSARPNAMHPLLIQAFAAYLLKLCSFLLLDWLSVLVS